VLPIVKPSSISLLTTTKIIRLKASIQKQTTKERVDSLVSNHRSYYKNH
jgi:hypothetical protein